MEGIVFGIAQINFEQSLSKITNDNRVTDTVEHSSINMASEHMILNTEQVATNSDPQKYEPSHYSSNTTADNDDGRQDSEDDESSSSKNESRKSCTLAEIRQLPSRASKESSMLGIKRRTIMKPTKRKQAIHKDFNSLKPADIKKIYLNKKLTNFRPSSLETIFEEPLTIENNLEEHEQVRLIGARKIKRSLCCSDGYKNNKTLVNKRRTKIKKTFGRRFALKKIPLEEFLDKLNTSMEENETSSNLCEQLWMNKDSLDHQVIPSDISTSTECVLTATSSIVTPPLV